jgi:hypothetical protein
MLGMRTKMVGSKVSTVGRISRPVYCTIVVNLDHLMSGSRRQCGESMSSNGNVTFHTRSSELSRLSGAAYNCRVLKNASTARIRVAPEVALRRRQGDIRVRLPAKLPKRADAETQGLRRKSGESIAYKHRALKRDICLALNSPFPAGSRDRGMPAARRRGSS